MKSENLCILSELSSKTRNDVIECLKQGRTHPEEIAKKIGITRQAVDVCLLKLYKLGIVDRDAIFPPKKRPKISYRLTERGIILLEDVENVVEKYRDMLEKDFFRAQEDLENQLLNGKISEGIYKKRFAQLKSYYAREE